MLFQLDDRPAQPRIRIGVEYTNHTSVKAVKAAGYALKFGTPKIP